MDTLNYNFNGVNFTNIMKAQFRKYFDEIYKGKNMVVDIKRSLINKDTLEIYRVHRVEFFFKINYFVEKIIIDRKNKVYNSWINSFQYKEECQFLERPEGIKYIQKFSVPFFLISKKQELFKKGCEVLDKILQKKEF